MINTKIVQAHLRMQPTVRYSRGRYAQRWFADHEKKKQVALLVYVARHSRSSLHLYRAHRYTKESSLLSCMLFFKRRQQCSVCSVFRHSGRGLCIRVLPHLLRTTQEPCPRPTFQGNSDTDVEPLGGLWIQPGPSPHENTLKLNYRHCLLVIHPQHRSHFFKFQVFFI